MSANAIKVIVNMRHRHILKFSFNEQFTFGHSFSLYRLIIESCLLIKNTITFKYNLREEKKITSFPVENKIPFKKKVITNKELINLGLEEDDEGELNLLKVLNANPEPCNPCRHGKNRGLTTRRS